MFIAMFISFFSFYLLLLHIPKHWLRRVVGYKGIADLLLHGTVIYMFLGTSTDGLLQAEGAAIMFSLYLRGYAYYAGYERMVNWKWQRFAPTRFERSPIAVQ